MPVFVGPGPKYQIPFFSRCGSYGDETAGGGYEDWLNEPSRGKTNNVVSNQVRHKPSCTSTEAG